MSSNQGSSYIENAMKIKATEVMNIKLETAKIVEELLGNLEADVSSEKDIKLLVDLVYQRELQIDELKKIDSKIHQNKL